LGEYELELGIWPELSKDVEECNCWLEMAPGGVKGRCGGSGWLGGWWPSMEWP